MAGTQGRQLEESLRCPALAVDEEESWVPECAVCCTPFAPSPHPSTPRVLPACGHSLCLACLLRLAHRWPGPAQHPQHPQPPAGSLSSTLTGTPDSRGPSSSLREPPSTLCPSVTVRCPECGVTSLAQASGSRGVGDALCRGFPRNVELLRLIDALKSLRLNKGGPEGGACGQSGQSQAPEEESKGAQARHGVTPNDTVALSPPSAVSAAVRGLSSESHEEAAATPLPTQGACTAAELAQEGAAGEPSTTRADSNAACLDAGPADDREGRASSFLRTKMPEETPCAVSQHRVPSSPPSTAGGLLGPGGGPSTLTPGRDRVPGGKPKGEGPKGGDCVGEGAVGVQAEAEGREAQSSVSRVSVVCPKSGAKGAAAAPQGLERQGCKREGQGGNSSWVLQEARGSPWVCHRDHVSALVVLSLCVPGMSGATQEAQACGGGRGDWQQQAVRGSAAEAAPILVSASFDKTLRFWALPGMQEIVPSGYTWSSAVHPVHAHRISALLHLPSSGAPVGESQSAGMGLPVRQTRACALMLSADHGGCFRAWRVSLIAKGAPPALEVQEWAQWQQAHDWRYTGVLCLAAAPWGVTTEEAGVGIPKGGDRSNETGRTTAGDEPSYLEEGGGTGWLVYSGGGDRTVKAWLLLTTVRPQGGGVDCAPAAELVAEMQGHTAPVCAVVVSGSAATPKDPKAQAQPEWRHPSDAPLLLSASWDATVRVWWRGDHSCLAVLRQHPLAPPVQSSTGSSGSEICAARSAPPASQEHTCETPASSPTSSVMAAPSLREDLLGTCQAPGTSQWTGLPSPIRAVAYVPGPVPVFEQGGALGPLLNGKSCGEGEGPGRAQFSGSEGWPRLAASEGLLFCGTDDGHVWAWATSELAGSLRVSAKPITSVCALDESSAAYNQCSSEAGGSWSDVLVAREKSTCGAWGQGCGGMLVAGTSDGAVILILWEIFGLPQAPLGRCSSPGGSDEAQANFRAQGHASRFPQCSGVPEVTSEHPDLASSGCLTADEEGPRWVPRVSMKVVGTSTSLGGEATAQSKLSARTSGVVATSSWEPVTCMWKLNSFDAQVGEAKCGDSRTHPPAAMVMGTARGKVKVTWWEIVSSP